MQKHQRLIALYSVQTTLGLSAGCEGTANRALESAQVLFAANLHQPQD